MSCLVQRATNWGFRILWPLVRWLPPRLGSPPRRALLRRFGAELHPTATIGPGVRVLKPAGLTMARGSGLARDVVIDARSGVSIGARTMIGFETVLLSATHPKDQVDDRSTLPLEGSPIIVGDACWVGARCMVLPGVVIGDGATIGAMSLVNRSIDRGCTAAGIPAKAIRSAT